MKTVGELHINKDIITDCCNLFGDNLIIVKLLNDAGAPIECSEEKFASALGYHTVKKGWVLSRKDEDMTITFRWWEE